MLCPSCPLGYHANHTTIGLQENALNSSDFQNIIIKVEKEQAKLEALNLVLSENEGKLCDENQATRAAIDKRAEDVSEYITSLVENLKRQSQEMFSREQLKLEDTRLNVFKCSELGEEILRELRGPEGAGAPPGGVSVSTLEKLGVYTKDVAQVKRVHTTCYGYQFAARSELHNFGLPFGTLKQVKVGTQFTESRV